MAVEASEVRSLVRDPSSVVFSDTDLGAAISASGGRSALRAAGVAFQSLAAEYALLGRSVRTDDLAIDTRSRGKDLLEVAKSFFDEAAAEDARADGSYVNIVPGRGATSRVTRVEGTPWPVAPKPNTPDLVPADIPGYWTTP
ncbi:MAG: hypothetical protein K0S65_89 [Labilithrix sp.]|jgi:hypothetical protein|nr:hypothetical protein [Labilithrix sp.]